MMGREKYTSIAAAHDLQHMTQFVKHGGHAWLPVELGHWYLLMMRQLMEVAG